MEEPRIDGNRFCTYLRVCAWVAVRGYQDRYRGRNCGRAAGDRCTGAVRSWSV